MKHVRGAVDFVLRTLAFSSRSPPILLCPPDSTYSMQYDAAAAAAAAAAADDLFFQAVLAGRPIR